MPIQITEDYLTKIPEEKAKLFKDRGLEASQLRKFYDELKLQEKRAYDFGATSDDKFKEKILPFVKFVKAKVAYSVGRKVSGKALVPDEFKAHMDSQIQQVNTFNDLKNFLLHYQAIICYFTYYKEKGQAGQGGLGGKK